MTLDLTFSPRKLIKAGYALKPNDMWPLYSDEAVNLDRSKYVTSSEISQCARKIKFDKLKMIASGYDPALGTSVDPRSNWGYFERGHGVEAWAVAQMQRAMYPGYGLRWAGPDQRSFVAGNQSGTPDGAFLQDGKTTFLGLEIKSIDPRTNVANLPKLAHCDQLMQNIDLIATETGLSPTGGVVLYIDASNWKVHHQFPLKYDEAYAERLERRANMIMEADTPADLKPEGLFMEDGCLYCPHTQQCGALINEERGLRNEKFRQQFERGSQFFGQPQSGDG